MEACLAHIDPPSRRDFLAAVHDNPASMTGLLCNLEVGDELRKDLKSILTSFTPIDFRGSTFINAFFMDVQFAGDVDFSMCHFRGRTWFDKADFPSSTSFVDSKFERDASFNGTRFHKDARFDTARFSSYVTFGSDFDHDAWFNGATFESWVSLKIARGCRVRLNGSRLSSVQLNSGERPDRAGLSPPLVIFNAAIFTGEAQVRTRGDIDISLAGVVLRNPLSLASWRGKMRLVSLRSAALEAPLVVGDGVDIGGCRMSHASGLDRLRIVEADPKWRMYRRRQVVADELESVRHTEADRLPEITADVEGEDIRALEVKTKTVEAVYRQLRTALETSKAFSAAADFFYGEMEMRRLTAPLLSVEHALLAVYKLTSGYGLRASRALATYVAILLLAGAALRYRVDWFVANPAMVAGSPGLHFSSYWDSVAIVARNSVSFFGGISEGLTAAGTALMYTVRLAGPTAFALIILALRSRVQR